MIVGETALQAVHAGRRRQLWLPITPRGPFRIVPPPRVAPGVVIRLQPRAFVKGTQVTVVAVRRLALVLVTDVDARATGYATISGAVRAFLDEHPGVRQVWAVTFARGDHSAFYAAHRERYLKAKGVGLTTDPAKAVPGEPAVTTDNDLLVARQARQKRDLEHRQALLRLSGEMEQLRRDSASEEFRRMLKRNIRNIRAHLDRVPSDGPVTVAATVTRMGAEASKSRRPSAVVSATPNPGRAA